MDITIFIYMLKWSLIQAPIQALNQPTNEPAKPHRRKAAQAIKDILHESGPIKRVFMEKCGNKKDSITNTTPSTVETWSQSARIKSVGHAPKKSAFSLTSSHNATSLFFKRRNVQSSTFVSCCLEVKFPGMLQEVSRHIRVLY